MNETTISINGQEYKTEHLITFVVQTFTVLGAIVTFCVGLYKNSQDLKKHSQDLKAVANEVETLSMQMGQISARTMLTSTDYQQANTHHVNEPITEDDQTPHNTTRTHIDLPTHNGHIVRVKI